MIHAPAPLNRRSAPAAVSAVATLTVLACLAPAVAQAYVDPGAGSLVLQTLAGLLALALVGARSLWARVTGRVRRSAPSRGARRRR